MRGYRLHLTIQSCFGFKFSYNGRRTFLIIFLSEMLTNWQFKCVWPQVIFTNNFNIQKTKDTSLLIFHHLCNSGSKIWNFWSQSFPKCKPINSLTGAMVWIHLIWMHRKNSHNYNLTTDKRTTARHYGLVSDRWSRVQFIPYLLLMCPQRTKPITEGIFLYFFFLLRMGEGLDWLLW